jgi:pectate lyase
MNARIFIVGLLAGALSLQAQTLSVNEAGGWLESAYVKWQTSAKADSYNVYVNGTGVSNQKLDDALIRCYGNYWRADAIGLKAGSYTLKVVPVTGGKEGAALTTSALTVTAHDRAGFAFSGSRIPGSYNLDGTPMTGAVVVYVTEKTKNTVSLEVTGASANPCVGIQNILYGFKKGKDARPLIVRVVGQVTDPATLDGGDLVVENDNLATGHIAIEGVGDDAVADGWGIRLKNASNVEVRNIGVMNVNSSEGDNVGLQQSNDHVWIHNTDLFYGDAGSDADQVKGDGAMDCKKSTFVTFSYNHFWDNGKSNLLGLSEGDMADLYITYHHNWYDHSDSRHPRVRFYSAHVYNNYYDGNAKYGAGSTEGSSVFMEGNYFRHCKYPMLTSMQGSDVWNETTKANDYKNMPTFSSEDGGTIKAWNNYMEGQKRFVAYGSNDFANSTVDFDAYVASSRAEKVPATVKAYQGGKTYNNFDTDASAMYAYVADAPEAAKAKVATYAGRVKSGEFKWTFDNAVDDTSSAVNAKLKAALVGYKTALVYIQGEGTPPTTSIASRSLPADNPIRFDVSTQRLSVAAGWASRATDLFALDGRRVLQASGSEPVSLAGLNRGIYLARIRTDLGIFEARILKPD